MPTPHQSFFTGWMLFLTPNQQRQSTDTCVLYSMFAIFSESNKHLWLEALASTPPGMPGAHPPPQFFGWGDVNGNIPQYYYVYVLSDIAEQYWLPSVQPQADFIRL